MTGLTGDGAKTAFLTIDGVIGSLNENRQGYTRQELVLQFKEKLSQSTSKVEKKSCHCLCSGNSSEALKAISTKMESKSFMSSSC